MSVIMINFIDSTQPKTEQPGLLDRIPTGSWTLYNRFYNFHLNLKLDKQTHDLKSGLIFIFCRVYQNQLLNKKFSFCLSVI